MRTTLVPSVLETVARNLAYRSHDLRLFELRPVFLPAEQEEELPEERTAAYRCYVRPAGARRVGSGPGDCRFL